VPLDLDWPQQIKGLTTVQLVGTLIQTVLWIFLLLLFARMILSWVPVLVRDWEPHGPVLVVAELVYSVTDPPLRALRKVLRPVRVGNVQLDLAFIGLYILVSILMRVNRAVFF
jgi:YggT family protein